MIKEQVKALWKICFDDSEEFVEMYFRLRYKTEVNVAIQSGDEVISALQMLPYPMTFGGETVQTSYISGACTPFRSIRAKDCDKSSRMTPLLRKSGCVQAPEI